MCSAAVKNGITKAIDFSIITPSFNPGADLIRCVASVCDQNGVEVEHIIQDGGSRDGTLDWVCEDSRVLACVENDTGMYQAINRGLSRSRGEFAAQLNADEQYLPGALKIVIDYFRANPEVQVIFTDTVVIDQEGKFISYRKAIAPTRNHIVVGHLNTFTCSTFFRAEVIGEHGLSFDEGLKAVADVVWVGTVLEKRIPFAVLNWCTSAFVDSGDNLSIQDIGKRERMEIRRTAPRWARLLRPVLIAQHRLKKWQHGAYRVGPFEYAVFTQKSPNLRECFSVSKATGIWSERL